MSSANPAPDPQPAARLVFRPSPLAIFAAVAFSVFAIPFAFGAPWFWLVYLAPIAYVFWILRTRTVVDPATVTVRRMFGSRRVTWSEISSLRLSPAARSRGARVSAVLTSGGELPLPAVHIRDLSQLAAVSGGRLPDPAGE